MRHSPQRGDVIEAFEFEDGGRTFTCRVEAPRASRPEAWWWFGVSTEDHHRYAPFQAAATDTESSVRSRIVAYYDDLLARRAAPATSYWRRGARTPDSQRSVAAAAEPSAPSAELR